MMLCAEEPGHEAKEEDRKIGGHLLAATAKMKQARPATTSPRTACIHGRRFTALQPTQGKWTEEERKAVEMHHYHSNADKTTMAMLQSSSRQNAIPTEALH